MTVRALEAMNVPHRVVIQPQEYDQYAAVMDSKKLLVLPFTMTAEEGGLVAARNWIWERSIEEGASHHWELDDNISSFHRLNRNLKPRVTSGTIFRAAEDFVERYENVAQAGFNYCYFALTTDKLPPFYLNTRIYSCTLNRNDTPHRYRGVYNDDTDISLRLLKDGWCTILFNAFLCWKTPTMKVTGGNTGIYQGDGRKIMAESLMEQHPDVTTVVWKWGRWQHQVDYRPFRKNKLIRRPDVEVQPGPNEYGMVLVDAEDAGRRQHSNVPKPEVDLMKVDVSQLAQLAF